MRCGDTAQFGHGCDQPDQSSAQCGKAEERQRGADEHQPIRVKAEIEMPPERPEVEPSHP